jgi:hypothetical protein
MFNGDTTFVESSNGRLYEVKTVEGYPLDSKGREVRCGINHRTQQVHVSEHVTASEKPALVARALGHRRSGASWRLVPVMGRVR